MAVIKPGEMVTLTPGLYPWSRSRGNNISIVLRVEQPPVDATERMALLLHPNGNTSWEFLNNLTSIPGAGEPHPTEK